VVAGRVVVAWKHAGAAAVEVDGVTVGRSEFPPGVTLADDGAPVIAWNTIASDPRDDRVIAERSGRRTVLGTGNIEEIPRALPGGVIVWGYDDGEHVALARGGGFAQLAPLPISDRPDTFVTAGGAAYWLDAGRVKTTGRTLSPRGWRAGAPAVTEELVAWSERRGRRARLRLDGRVVFTGATISGVRASGRYVAFISAGRVVLRRAGRTSLP
jgi:hypothetical protein